MIGGLGRVLAWAGVPGLLLGCVTVPEFRHLEREVAKLERQQGGLESGNRAGERLADLGSQVESLQEEVARLRGQVEETRHLAERALAQAERAPASGGSPLPPTASGGEVPVPYAPTPTPTPGAAPQESADAQTRASDATGAARSSEIRDYEEAFRLYRIGDYSSAVDRFGTFLQTHASSDYADNALFWIGECYFKLGDQEQAVVTFAEVVERYPDGNKVPDALYRQGRAMLELGEKTGNPQNYTPAAREVFETIVEKYPESDRVGEAKRLLEKLSP